MAGMNEFCLCYDGSFAGFLTCLDQLEGGYESPAAFQGPEEGGISLYPTRQVETDQAKARAYYRRIGEKLGKGVRKLVALAFLTCLPEKEMDIYAYLKLGWQIGPGILYWHTDPRVAKLESAVRSLANEEDHARGFLRFSDHGGVLVAQLAPKNRLLPLLRPHFCQRYSTETFLIYDQTHKECLFHQEGQWRIIPVDEFQEAPPDETERQFRALWRTFFRTVAIPQRENPALQRSHLPLRWRGNMTEFQRDEADSLAEFPSLPYNRGTNFQQKKA